jgi:mono/diheme cytochrome c family protein
MQRTVFLFALILASRLAAQTFNAQPAAAFPRRAPGDPESIARGKAAYSTNCAYCHGDDARGGENGGTNLIRSDYLMKDQKGEVLAPFLQNPGGGQHTVKFQFIGSQAADLAAFIHSFPLNSRDPGRMRPPTIVVGNAKEGEAFFKSKCASCHSPTGDLKGIASRISNPRTLQQTWLIPPVPRPGSDAGESRVPPTTVTVNLNGGQKVNGRLGRIDDFIVTLTEDDGTPRSFRRDGDTPKVEVHDPLRPHKDLLPTYSDNDIHNVTAYLVTLQ